MNPQVKAIVDVIRSRTDFVPEVALTLGSGLGGFAEKLDPVVCEIPYGDLPGFPVSTAPGHVGKFICGYIGETPVICMQGRVHYYEGYPIDKVILPVRVMHALGAKILFLTNASGGIRYDYRVGTLALIKDHISLFVPNPLNDEDEGVRFPDMTAVYDPALCSLIQKTAVENDIDLKDGIYCQLTGPSFETPAEIRFLRTIGADMAGMSTVVEAITARHCGMRVCGISLISNLASGISPVPLSSEDVNRAGQEAAPRFTKLVYESIRKMGGKEASK